MKVPIRWLKDYVDIEVTIDELSERLTLAGLEVASVDHIGDWWDRDKIVVGQVREVHEHPNADRLVLVDVDYGGPQIEQCVTGAPNLFAFKGKGAVALSVAFAMEGATLYDGHKDGFVKTRLKRTKIRGVPSRAMVCSEKELGISEEHEGIMFLPDDAPVGTPLADYLGDTVLDLDLTPNLARCFSMIGVAREVSALTGIPHRYPSTDWVTDGPPASELAAVRIEAPDLCGRFIATIIRDVDIRPAPTWMQDRVRKAGMRPISNIVDITNYVMLEWGQPLHAFDYDKLVARAGGGTPTIIVRRALPGETMKTLDGIVRTFDKDTLLICDTQGAIGIAGVMGGFDTEIDENTQTILLEAANFDLVSIRRTAQSLKLPSEASQRFGRGIHPALAGLASRRASELMRVLADGTVSQGMVDAYPRKPEVVHIELTCDQVERSLGLRFSVEDIVAVLEPLEFSCHKISDSVVRVTVPDHRLDCEYPADLIEEVARVHGYDRIPVTEMADQLPPQRTNRALVLEEQVRDILVGCGLQELVTYSLTNLEQEAALYPTVSAHDLAEDTYVSLENPISQERTVMRHHLLGNALEVAAANLRFFDRITAFEIGKVFLLAPGDDLPEEPTHLSLVMVGPRRDQSWLAEKGSDLDFFDVKGVLETLLSRLHIDGIKYESAEHPSLQVGRSARLVTTGPEGDTVVEVGFLGEVHPAVRSHFGLPECRIAVAELDLGALLGLVPDTWLVEMISPYPAVLQDLAIVVDEGVPAASVRDVILSAGGFLLKSAELFDVYRGKSIPDGKKSLAYALTFQAPDKTLRDAIVNKQVRRIVKQLSVDLSAELRS